jgi:hypothetical protein
MKKKKNEIKIEVKKYKWTENEKEVCSKINTLGKFLINSEPSEILDSCHEEQEEE